MFYGILGRWTNEFPVDRNHSATVPLAMICNSIPLAMSPHSRRPFFRARPTQVRFLLACATLAMSHSAWFYKGFLTVAWGCSELLPRFGWVVRSATDATPPGSERAFGSSRGESRSTGQHRFPGLAAWETFHFVLVFKGFWYLLQEISKVFVL